MAEAVERTAQVRIHDPALLFEARAKRLRALAAGHSAGDWLLLLSRVADGQRAAVREIAVTPVPAALGSPRAEVGPPLAVEDLPRDGAWRRMLGIVLAAAKAPGLPVETLDALRRLGDSGASQLEAIADAVLAGDVAPDRLAAAPFVGAALQAWFAVLAARLDPASLRPGTDACPACGSPPVAGVVQGGDRLRFLSCSLCTSEWNVPRLRCVLCGDEGDLAYYEVEGDHGGKAEACPSCRAYVKLFDEEKRPGLDPAADDAATLALDLLLAEDGWSRVGANLYLATAAPPA
jgi:FdhE protein